MPLKSHPRASSDRKEPSPRAGDDSVPLTERRWRWSLSERPRSAAMSLLSWGVLKKKFPAVSNAREYV
jgi:hypothetical protein